MIRFAWLALAAFLLPLPAWAQAKPAISIVAAENFYGDVAQQIAGPNAEITSLMSNPDQDPHLFEANPSTARVLSTAAIVIYNGADYDPWIVNLLSSAKSKYLRLIGAA